MKQSKRFKQAMHAIRINNFAKRMGKSFAEFEKEQMEKPGKVRSTLRPDDVFSATSRPNPLREHWQKHGDRDTRDSGGIVITEMSSEEKDIAYAESVERRAKIREHFGVSPRGEGRSDREQPNRSAGESEANRDGYMSGDEE